jgi:hypothetical protein
VGGRATEDADRDGEDASEQPSRPQCRISADSKQFIYSSQSTSP